MRPAVKALGALFVSLLLAASLVFAGGAAPAQAASTDGVCPSASVCLWVNVNYTGTRWTRTTGSIWQMANSCVGLPSYITNAASSVWTNSGPTGWFIELVDETSGGPFLTLPFGFSYPLNGPRAYMNDITSKVCVMDDGTP